MKEDLRIIRKTVCDYYNLSLNELNSKCRKREIVFVRQICHYFAHKITKNSLSVIGANMGGKNHATVLYSDKVIKGLLSYDQQLINEVSELQEKIRKAFLVPFIKKEITVYDGYSVIIHRNTGFLI